MTTRPLLLITLLGLAACTVAPLRGAEIAGGLSDLPDRPVPDFCKAAFEAAPSDTLTDYSARVAERASALPDGEPSPELEAISRPAPQFPRCAISYGFEGHCDKVFDGAPDATPANVLPVCSSRLFERDPASGVNRWTFVPPGDGPRPAVISRLTFKLADLYEDPAAAAGAQVVQTPASE